MEVIYKLKWRRGRSSSRQDVIFVLVLEYVTETVNHFALLLIAVSSHFFNFATLTHEQSEDI